MSNVKQNNFILIYGLNAKKEWVDFFLNRLDIAIFNLNIKIEKDIFKQIRENPDVYIINGELCASKMIEYAIELLFENYRDKFIERVCDYISSNYSGEEYDDGDEYEITLTYDNIYNTLLNKKDYLFNIKNKNIKTRYGNAVDLFNYRTNEEGISDFIYDLVLFYREELIDE
jgi:hypothetical protein